MRLSVTGAISFIFTLIGVGTISILIGMSAYLAALYLPYYQERIESPLILSFVATAISFLVSCIYLSMIDVSATSVLQCFLFNQDHGRKNQQGNERIIEILAGG